MTKYQVLTDIDWWLAPERLSAQRADPLPLKDGQTAARGQGPALNEVALLVELDELMEGAKDGPVANSDAEASLRVHSCLMLSRRDAADRDLWAYLNAAACWRYVCWRWAGRDGIVKKERVAGNLDRSTLGRLWWMAELCLGIEGRDLPKDKLKGRLTTLLQKQDMAVALYERPRLFGRAPLTAALLSAADDTRWKEDAFRRFAKNCVGLFGVKLPAIMHPSRVEQTIHTQAEDILTSLP